LLGLLISQPALLIPNKKIYTRIFSAIRSSSVYDQERFFTLKNQNVILWLETLSTEFNLPNTVFVLVFVISFFLFFYNLSKKDYKSTYYLFTFVFFTIFIVFNVERTWSYYLALPSLLLLVYIFQDGKLTSLKKLILLLPVFFIFLNGFIYHNDKAVNSYFSTSLSKDQTFFDTVSYLDNQYSKSSYVYNLVYWDPDLYFPRIDLNYNGNYKVLENWEIDFGIEPLNSKVDYIVTLQRIDTLSENVNEIKIGEAYIYYLSK